MRAVVLRCDGEVATSEHEEAEHNPEEAVKCTIRVNGARFSVYAVFLLPWRAERAVNKLKASWVRRFLRHQSDFSRCYVECTIFRAVIRVEGEDCATDALQLARPPLPVLVGRRCGAGTFGRRVFSPSSLALFLFLSLFSQPHHCSIVMSTAQQEPIHPNPFTRDAETNLILPPDVSTRQMLAMIKDLEELLGKVRPHGKIRLLLHLLTLLLVPISRTCSSRRATRQTRTTAKVCLRTTPPRACTKTATTLSPARTSLLLRSV